MRGHINGQLTSDPTECRPALAFTGCKWRKLQQQLMVPSNHLVLLHPFLAPLKIIHRLLQDSYSQIPITRLKMGKPKPVNEFYVACDMSQLFHSTA